MNRINSKAKGSKNERYAAKALEEWVGFPFTRVPQSGGLRWQGGQNITGDIIPEDMYKLQDFPFSVEVKARKELDFEGPTIR
jgi:Holliday junction resolvase